MSSIAAPCVIVIFGARGDLTKRLLIPAIYNLRSQGLLDPAQRILGVDHGDVTPQAWLKSLSDLLEQFSEDGSSEFHPDSIDADAWKWIEERSDYFRGDFEDAAAYSGLAKKLDEMSAAGAPKNCIFYVATAPQFFGPVVDGLEKAGLLKEAENAFRRVVIEKPFGRDEASATKLNLQLLGRMDESQIYRIDHFMGKEAVRGIFTWRFANRIFEPLLRAEHVDHVQITAAENIDIEGRAKFYDATGALRDMVPNHLFSVLSMLAMDEPKSLSSEDIRAAREAVVKAIKPIAADAAARGRYASGEQNGKPVKAYIESEGLAPDSRTETYAAVRVELDLERWQGVPFYIRTGKALSAHETHAVVFLKAGSAYGTGNAGSEQRALRFQLSGKSGIRFDIDAKQPGVEDQPAPAKLNFSYRDDFSPGSSVGYEVLLYDCMSGNQTLFHPDSEIEAAWHALGPVLAAWQAAGIPEDYAPGSAGPASADALIGASGRVWLPLQEDKKT